MTTKMIAAAAAVALAAATPTVAPAQTSPDDPGFCTEMPAVCLAGAAWITWQLLLMSEPGPSGPRSVPPSGADDGPRYSSRDGYPDSDDGCFWGSLLYGTCVN